MKKPILMTTLLAALVCTATLFCTAAFAEPQPGADTPPAPPEKPAAAKKDKAPAPKTFAGAMQAARSSIHVKKYKEAREWCDVARKLAVDLDQKIQVQELAAMTYELEKNFPAQRAELTKILELPGVDVLDKAGALFDIAGSYVDGGDLKNGRASFLKILKFPALDQELRIYAQQGVAYTYQGEGNYPTARNEFSKLLAMKILPVGVKADALFGIGECYFFEDRYPEARDYLNRALKIKELDAENRKAAREYLQEMKGH